MPMQIHPDLQKQLKQHQEEQMLSGQQQPKEGVEVKEVDGQETNQEEEDDDDDNGDEVNSFCNRPGSNSR